jgi:histidinol-phosphate aminotransferase
MAEKADRPFVRLDLNENPLGPSPRVMPALQREFGRLHRYADHSVEDLISAIAAREGIAPEQIILGDILELLGIYLAQTGGRGSEIVHSHPGYTALIDSAVAVGGNAVAVPLDASLENDLPAIERALGPRTRAVFLVNPQNPTGIAADPIRWRAAVREFSARTLVIVDEAYVEFLPSPENHSVVDLVRGGGNVIVFRTFAKAYGLGGLDVGYGLMPLAVARALTARGAGNPHLLNRLAIAAAIASLGDREYLARVAAAVGMERREWLAWLKERLLRHTPSSANFVFFETGIEHARLSAALRDRGVLVGRAFAPYTNWVRVSIGLPSENELARGAIAAVLACPDEAAVPSA